MLIHGGTLLEELTLIIQNNNTKSFFLFQKNIITNAVTTTDIDFFVTGSFSLLIFKKLFHTKI